MANPDTTVTTGNDQITKLPRELQLMIIENFVSPEDRRSLSLVSRYWANIVLKKAFYHFRSNLSAGDPWNPHRSIQTVLADESRITKFAEKVTISWDKCKPKEELAVVEQFLNTIPPNQLTGLEVANARMEVSVICDMVKRHKLPQIQVQLSHWMNLVEDEAAITNLSELSRIWLEMCAGCDFELLQLRQHFPTLSLFHLQGWSSETVVFSPREEATEPPNGPLDETNRPHASAGHKLIQVHHLILQKVALDKPELMPLRIDISKLCEIYLIDVKKVHHVLDLLTIAFQHSDTCLIEFQIIDDGRPDLSVPLNRIPIHLRSHQRTPLDNFLLSFRGLEQLHINHKDFRFIDIAAITNHGTTLKELLYISQICTHFTGLGLRDIARECPHLEFLGVNLYKLSNQIVPFGTVGHGDHRDIHDALTGIASLPNLHMLRLMDPPDKPSTPDECSHCASIQRPLQDLRRRAAYLFDDLVLFGSKVKVIAFSRHDEEVSGSVHYYYELNKTYRKSVEAIINKARPVLEWKALNLGLTIMGDLYGN